MLDADMEKVEEMVENESIITKAGYIDSRHFEEHRSVVAAGMKKYGSEFVRALGKALEIAHRDDALKIMRYWNNMCDTHATLYKMYLAKAKTGHNLASNCE